ncbi:MAG: tetratricopeptide repeat protein [Pirellulales bacterium]
MRTSRLAAVVGTIGLACCAGWTKADEPVRADAAVHRFDGLGEFGRRITTSSPDAQAYFDQGLKFLYAFNHDEAIRAFEQGVKLDPRCAMAWWGIALANGPHVNNTVVPPDRARRAWEAWQEADRLTAGATEVERALIGALKVRYSPAEVDDRRPLDEAYAQAMREVWEKFPRDADVGALTAEAWMDLRPWDLWTAAGDPQPGTDFVVATLEQVLATAPQHPLGLHLYIHAVEASRQPERADDEADRLRLLQPGLGHMVHMPSHIDVRRGRWSESAAANRRAIEADDEYARHAPSPQFYRVYMAHNHHMLAYSLMMMGQSRGAIDAIQAMIGDMPSEWIRENAPLADGFTAMPLEVLVRFGKWQEILDAPEPPEYLPLARAMRHYARGIAHAALKDVEKAQAELKRFEAAREQVPPDWIFGNNKAHDLLAVAEDLMKGEILYRRGEVDQGLAALRRAVELEDQLRYSEPPDWIHPVRHALGATLLQAGRPEEAETVYRADLAKLPLNGWSLFGLARSLELQGKKDEAAGIRAQFEAAWRDADVQLTSSCFCQP